MTRPANDFDLTLTAKGQWMLVRPGKEDLTDVRVRRAFPWSAAEQFISVRGKDGKEVLMIESLTDLPADLAERVREALRRTSLVPKVTRIEKLKLQFGFQSWAVETTAGPVEFRVQEREDLRFLPDGRFTVKDADGNLYEIPRLEDLDPASRKLLEQCV